MSGQPKALRCAIYTRKSTEHGLELEFNSLDAQREACEAYIKSQSSQGWRAVSDHYDDPAYSGGNLQRPALQQLLKDIDAGRVDVVVVYKIDRLTRSLADFAKLVEAFDAKSISFVAVTQQFNTTTSMGRLTLNVLLSFAQFERELSSERVRDKIAASRRKGKWTGGNVPFGYAIKNKKLMVDGPNAACVREIFSSYLKMGSINILLEPFNNSSHTVRQSRNTNETTKPKAALTHGSLTYLLKNRIYRGEVHHRGQWFKGEHDPIVDAELFGEVQNLLTAQTVKRQNRRSESGALLMGKIHDDRGNLMSPSFSVKNGVRYRFYVSTALLRGRKDTAGNVGRLSAPDIETTIEAKLREKLGIGPEQVLKEVIFDRIDRVVAKPEAFIITVKSTSEDTRSETIEVPFLTASKARTSRNELINDARTNERVIQSLVNAHAWLKLLTNGTYTSVDSLAKDVRKHPKIIRQTLKLAFLAPDITKALIEDHDIQSGTAMNLARLNWSSQRRLFHTNS